MNASQAMPVFDTQKAVTALTDAGFDAVQAKAVVKQISDAVDEHCNQERPRPPSREVVLPRLITKADLLAFELHMNAKFDQQNETLLRYALGIVALTVTLTKLMDVLIG